MTRSSGAAALARSRAAVAAAKLSEHEQLIVSQDAAADYCSVIAIHSTALGPAIGGTRFRAYRNEREAIRDALRLSRAMTLKAAVAGLRCGGGKAVIIAPPAVRSREALLHAHARVVHQLGGRYVTAMDMGLTTDDLAVIANLTPFVSVHRTTGGAGGADTARGVLRAMLAAAEGVWGTPDIANRVIGIQGCGNVGVALMRLAVAGGATVLIADPDQERLAAAADHPNVRAIDAAMLLSTPMDVFAPCGPGDVITAGVASQLQASAIVGGANNQLADDRHARVLQRRGIAYVPDFVANAGGVIAGAGERQGWSAAKISDAIDGIFHTTRRVLRSADSGNCTPLAAAELMAQHALESAVPGAH